jgi:hypothetical protein
MISALAVGLFLNHLAILVDDQTWFAIRDLGKNVNQVSNIQVISTTANVGSWTGLYLTGKNTYIEFFREGEPPNGDVKFTGELNLGVDQTGELDLLYDQLQVDWPRFDFKKGQVAKKGEPPSIAFVGASVPAGTFEFGMMEYLGATDASRGKYNAKDYDEKLAFEEVDEVWLDLTPSEAEVYRAIAKTSGCKFKIHIRETDSPAKHRVRKLSLALNRIPEDAKSLSWEIGFGSKLIFDPATKHAIWTFL